LKRRLLPVFGLLVTLACGREFWSHRVDVENDVPYGDDPAQIADVYTQGERIGEPEFFAPSKVPRPTLLWIHGGGWLRGDKATQVLQFVPFLERGWDVVNINFRQGSGTAPLAIDDALCAYKWSVERARKIGSAPDQIVVAGASSGGHLALMIGLLNTTGSHPCRTNPPPMAVINWFGVTDVAAVETSLYRAQPEINFPLTWIGSKTRLEEIASTVSPMSFINGDAPPIITLHGTDDSIVPFTQAEALHASLTTPNRLITLSGGNHGGFSDAQYQQVMTAIFDFLDEHD